MRLNEREIHGGTPMAGRSDRPIIVRETDDKVVVQEGSIDRLSLPPAAARFLARKLNRIALRIERRTAAIATEARRAETENTGSVHEGAGPKDIAQ